jgi:hypothetical protein
MSKLWGATLGGEGIGRFERAARVWRAATKLERANQHRAYDAW